MVADPPRSDSSTETTPKKFPEVTPDFYAQAVGTGWLVESMMQIQRSIGQLTATVDTLKESVKEQDTQIRSVRKTIHIATGVIIGGGALVTIILSFIAWVLDSGFDSINTLLTNFPQTP